MRFITSITLFAAGLLGASALAIFNNTCCNIYWDDQKPEGERNPVRPLIWCDPAVDYAATCPKPKPETEKETETETEPKVGSDNNIDTSTDPSNDTCTNPPCQSTDRDYRQTRQ
ncbi:hypothetical protein H4R33_006572, partial [Dimargaris cristalligena]